jgi:hypothetical protein
MESVLCPVVELFTGKSVSGHVLAGHALALEHEVLAEGQRGRLIPTFAAPFRAFIAAPRAVIVVQTRPASGPCSLDTARGPCSSATSLQTCVLVRARSSALGPRARRHEQETEGNRSEPHQATDIISERGDAGVDRIKELTDAIRCSARDPSPKDRAPPPLSSTRAAKAGALPSAGAGAS